MVIADPLAHFWSDLDSLVHDDSMANAVSELGETLKEVARQGTEAPEETRTQAVVRRTGPAILDMTILRRALHTRLARTSRVVVRRLGPSPADPLTTYIEALQGRSGRGGPAGVPHLRPPAAR